jgi:hemolysin activation/secretion protein
MKMIHLDSKQKTEPDEGGSSKGSPVQATAMLALMLAANAAFAQTSVPAPGGILNDLERSLPMQPLTTPDGVKVDIPDAPAMDSATNNGRVTVRSYRIVGNTAFSQDTLLALVANRTGELSLAELNTAAGELTAYYRSHGFPLARAYLPRQEIQHGLVTIAVLEGRYDRIDTQNSSRVSNDRAARTLQSSMCKAGEECKGALIDRRPLERGLMLLNDTPGAQAAARLSPGSNVGTSTLTVEASADPLASGSLQLDNNGNYYSGVARGIGTLWINSPTGIGDQITAQAVASAVHGNLYYGALGYGLPLGYGGLRLGVRGSYLDYELGDRYESLEAHGTVKSVDASLFYPFVRNRAANLYGSVTYGDRRFYDELDAIGAESERRIRGRAELGLNGDFRDELFGTTAINTASVVFTTGDLNLDPVLSFVDALSTRASGSYEKWGASYSRLQSIAGRTSVYLRVAAQGTSKNLDSYEKFALGGLDSVRAYPAGETLVDEALLYSVEVRQSFGVAWARALEGSVFYDHARGDLNASPWAPTTNRATLSGVGLGLNCWLSDGMVLRSIVAFRGNRPATAAPDSSYQYTLSLNKAF